MSPDVRSADNDVQTSIHLYAEHLQNIRTLSIQASLATVSNQETSATLSADGSLLTLLHEGQSASVRLPLSLGDHSDATLTMPAASTKDLSFRLNVAEQSGEPGQLGSKGSLDGPVMPWMSGDMSAESEIQCVACNTVLVPRGKVKHWKDLPSEGWAEMMEFWHCHKPDVPHDHVHDHTKDTDNTGRGFAADSTLTVRACTGLVGPTEFLLSLEDCVGIETQSISSSTQAAILNCSSCSVAVGVLDPATGGYKLRKSSLAVSLHHESHLVSYGQEKWLSCSILSSAESQGVRRLLVHSVGDKENTTCVLHLWLFASDITVSSSAAETPEPMRVAKILFKPGEASDIDRLDGMTSTEGELELSTAEWRNLRTQLHESSSLLPQTARTFQDWDVGLLARFTETDVSRADT